MKNILLLLLLISSTYASDAKIYFGSSVGFLNETIDDTDISASAPTAKIKIGYGVREAYAIEFSLDYTKNESRMYSTAGNDYDGDKYGFNVDFVKGFDYDIYVLPYLKAGFGAGIFKINRKIQDKLHYGSYNIGFGTFLPVNEHFDFELGYEYRWTSYEAVDIISEQVRHSSKVNIAYLGFNIRY